MLPADDDDFFIQSNLGLLYYEQGKLYLAEKYLKLRANIKDKESK